MRIDTDPLIGETRAFDGGFDDEGGVYYVLSIANKECRLLVLEPDYGDVNERAGTIITIPCSWIKTWTNTIAP